MVRGTTERLEFVKRRIQPVLGEYILCSFSLLAQRKRTKRKGALSLGPSEFSVLLERSGARGNSPPSLKLRRVRQSTSVIRTFLRCSTSRQWVQKRAWKIISHYIPSPGGHREAPTLQVEKHFTPGTALLQNNNVAKPTKHDYAKLTKTF
jgi:hypothetical protein